MKWVLGVFSCLLGLLYLSGSFHSSLAYLRDSTSPAKEYLGTPFDKLTSPVWRYKQPFQRRDLNPVPSNHPYPEPQPHRDRPERPCLGPKGEKLYVTLAGTEAFPGKQIAVIDVGSRKLIKKIEVGSRPYMSVLHPAGRFLVVINEFSNYATVIDTTRDEVSGEIPLDYYCQGIVFTKDGTTAYVANRYLDQVLVLRLIQKDGNLLGAVEIQGGFSEAEFLGKSSLSEVEKSRLKNLGHSAQRVQEMNQTKRGGLNSILRARCASCHRESAGGFLCGADPVENFLSAIENSVGGRPMESPLLKAVVSSGMGGYGDQKKRTEFHPGGVLFQEGEPALLDLVRWIKNGEGGPGIPVSNPGSHPKDLALSPDENHLFIGNTGTQDLSVIDLRTHREAGGIFLQNLASHIEVVSHPEGDGNLLVALSLGVGFGAPKSRDPLGAETWNKQNSAAQFTVLRDPETTDALPLEKQFVMGSFDAVDGTWNFKMRDIQNDLIAIDLDRLKIPERESAENLEYILLANTYEAHPDWVRYTSDSAEATVGDIKGDIPPQLQRVPGAFPEWSVSDGEYLYVSMAGTFEVIQWKIHWGIREPSNLLEPVRSFSTGLRPMGLALGVQGTSSEGLLFCANQLSETVSFIDLKTGEREDVIVGNLKRPVLDTDAEKGELVVHSSVFTSDGDTSCLHCHYRDTGDGRGWGAAETVGQDQQGHLTPGGTLGIPQMRNLFAIQPFYFEGTHLIGEGQGADINEPASSIDFDREVWTADYSALKSPIPAEERHLMHEELKERVEVRSLGEAWYDLEERRNEFLRVQSLKYFGEAHTLLDLYRYVGAWMGNTPHLVPNPFDQENPSVQRGKRLFHSATVMCGVCHTLPEFTSKDSDLTHNERKALPSLTTITRRDASYTLVSVRAMEIANGRKFDMEIEDRGRVEKEEGTFTTMQLRGIFDRPPVFLHHGRSRSLREVICTPNHPALRTFRYPLYQGPEIVRKDRKEIGFNELTRRKSDGPLDEPDQVFDTHGGTSHLTVRQIEDLVNFMKAIQ